MTPDTRPPEQIIRDWLDANGPTTVELRAFEETWEIDWLDGGDRRRIELALERVDVRCEPPLTSARRGDSIEVAVAEPEPAPEPEPEAAEPDQLAAAVAPRAPLAAPESEPKPAAASSSTRWTVAFGIALALMVAGALGAWSKASLVADYGLQREGPWVLAAAVVAALAAGVYLRSRRPAWLPLVSSGVAAFAAAVVASDWHDLVDDPTLSPAWGIYAAFAGSALMVLLSMFLMVRRN